MEITKATIVVEKVYTNGSVEIREINFVHMVNSMIKYHFDGSVKEQVATFDNGKVISTNELTFGTVGKGLTQKEIRDNLIKEIISKLAE